MTQQPPALDRRVYVGRIVKVHGLRGDLRIVPLTWRPERFNDLDSIWLETSGGEVHSLTIKRRRIETGGVYLRFKEAAQRELAEKFVGGQLFIDESQREPLPEQHYYLDDLVGCQVIDSVRGSIGELVEVMELPANDVWQVQGTFGEVLIPAIRDVVIEVDLSNRRIQVDLPEGLIDEESQPSKRETSRERGKRLRDKRQDEGS